VKEVNLYFRGSQKGKEGSGYVVWEFGGKTKEEYIPDANGSTLNRSFLNMVMYAISKLREPCKINVYTLGSIGGKSKLYKKNWRHRDLGDQLLQMVAENNHEINFYTCGTEDGELFFIKKPIFDYIKRKMDAAERQAFMSTFK
jgi:ribonuclease HI